MEKLWGENEQKKYSSKGKSFERKKEKKILCKGKSCEKK